SMDQSGYGVRTHGTVSTMVFRLPGAMRGRQAVLTLRTTDPVHPALTYGDVALRDNPLQTGTGFTVVIPRELVDRAITTAQTLEFKSGTSDPLVMKLLSIQLSGN
ncbi:MAG TPA: hypothetical protein VFE07_04400, partial [Marmoricola sp.]|nr:hypothetical protein [Marmoricola sp.]